MAHSQPFRIEGRLGACEPREPLPGDIQLDSGVMRVVHVLASALRLTSVTRAPLSSATLAVALPIPLLPPTTMTCLEESG